MIRPVRPCVLLTRPLAASQRFERVLQDQGDGDFDVIQSPLLDIVFTGQVPDLNPYAGLVFTSVHGVSAVGQNVIPTNMPAYVVGPATFAAAKSIGFSPIQGGGNAKALIEKMSQDAPKGRWLHLRGVHSRGDIAKNLGKSGTDIDEAIMYDQRLLPLSDKALEIFQRGNPVIIPLFSPRTARHLADHITGQTPIYFACLSTAVQNQIKHLDCVLNEVAQTADQGSMSKLVLRHIAHAQRVEGSADAQ